MAKGKAENSKIGARASQILARAPTGCWTGLLGEEVITIWDDVESAAGFLLYTMLHPGEERFETTQRRGQMTTRTTGPARP